MTMLTITTAFRDLRTALSVNTQRLCPDERHEAIALAEVFVERLKVELWMDQMGIDVPVYDTIEWRSYHKEYCERGNS